MRFPSRQKSAAPSLGEAARCYSVRSVAGADHAKRQTSPLRTPDSLPRIQNITSRQETDSSPRIQTSPHTKRQTPHQESNTSPHTKRQTPHQESKRHLTSRDRLLTKSPNITSRQETDSSPRVQTSPHAKRPTPHQETNNPPHQETNFTSPRLQKSPMPRTFSSIRTPDSSP